MVENDFFNRLAAPRYVRLPFPSYRYQPGRSPHPTAHPQGHSFAPAGQTHHEATWVPPADWAKSEEYLYGCDLYNHGYWWEAHESWEDLWRLAAKGDAQREFLQGLIQVSACHLNLLLLRMEGFIRLRRTSFEHLNRACQLIATPRFMGIDCRGFMESVDQYYQSLQHGPIPFRHDASLFPFLLPR